MFERIILFTVFVLIIITACMEFKIETLQKEVGNLKVESVVIR